MKKSIFNVIVNIDNEQSILYNTYSTSLVVINSEMSGLLKSNNLEAINHEDTIALYELGFLIDDNRDQIRELEQIRKNEISKIEQVVTIFSTNSCNARCFYCFEKGINYQHMSVSIALSTVEFLKDFYPQKELSIKWFGGEPLYNFEIIRMITDGLISAGYKLKCHITTNGSLLSQKMLDFFKSNYSMVTFQITIDDIGNAYNKIKSYIDGVTGDPYQTVVDNCKMVMHNKMHVSIRINYLFKDFDKAVSIFHSLQKEFDGQDTNYYLIYLANLTLPGKRTYIQSVEDKEMAVKMQEFNRRHRPAEVIDDKYLLYKHDLLPKLKHCSATNKYNLTIAADGNIFKCHRLVQYSEYIIGTVKDGISSSSDSYTNFVEHRVIDSECRKCFALPICQESCRALYILEGNKVDCDVKKILPNLIKNYYADLLKTDKIN